MNRAIIIHGWEETPDGQWLPWLKEKLEKNGWAVDVPEMPNTKTPKLQEWMDTLTALNPDENTVLIGHSLANALILHYLEKPDSKIKGAVMVAAWDWLIESVKDFHKTFFENNFDYDKIKQKKVPLVIVNSTNDRWIELEKSRLMKEKLNAQFIAIENAGHFMEKDGYKEFSELVKIIEKNFS